MKGIWVFVVLFSEGLDIFKIKCWRKNKNKFWAPVYSIGEGGAKAGFFPSAAQGPVRRPCGRSVLRGPPRQGPGAGWEAVGV